MPGVMYKNRNLRGGQAMLIIVLLTTVFLSLAAMSVDFVFAYVVKSRLVMAVDAAALGAVRNIGQGTSRMNKNIELLFKANFPDDFMLATGSSYNPPIVTTPSAGVRQIEISAETILPTFFMRILGYENLTLRASAKAARRDVNMMLVVDRSASLHPNNADAWDDVQEAANFFVSQFDDDRDQVGLVTFGTNAQVDVAMATNFQTTITNAMNSQIVPNSASTNAPQGLWLGYGELLAEADPNPLNVIIFFTDGQPSSYTATFPVRTAAYPGNDSVPYCGSSPQEAVIGAFQSGADFYEIAGFWNPQADGPPITTGSSGGSTYDHFVKAGCDSPNNTFTPWASRTEWLFNPSSCLPSSWTAGYSPPSGGSISKTFSITSGPYSVNQCHSWLHSTSTNWSVRNFRGTQVHNASKNLAIAIAENARQNSALGDVRVYSIGLGGWGYPADAEFLQRVSNDPDSPTYSDSEPTGLYAYAPTPMQLRQAFQSVANEIFRLVL